MRLTITEDDEASPPETARYELKRLELIGIARHAAPVAATSIGRAWIAPGR
jgi:hypothetical protein